ncbi:MAG: ATP-binding protein [Candidatus Babeliales bacterium]
MKLIRVNRINDDPGDFIYLFRLRELALGYNENIRLNFSECNFLRPNAVAFIAALHDEINSGKYSCSIDWQSISPRLLTNLQQNGFCYYFDKSIRPWEGNSIRFRKDIFKNGDFENIIKYLQEHCLGRSYLTIPPKSRHEIVSNLLEVYINSNNHSMSGNTVYTCGQFFPGLKYLKVTILDLGVGIPFNIDRIVNKPELVDAQLIRVAFLKGITSTGQLGGNGLPQLYEFIKEYSGTLDVYSGKGLVRGNKAGLWLHKHEQSFKGTIVHLTLKCDIIYS